MPCVRLRRHNGWSVSDVDGAVARPTVMTLTHTGTGCLHQDSQLRAVCVGVLGPSVAVSVCARACCHCQCVLWRTWHQPVGHPMCRSSLASTANVLTHANTHTRLNTSQSHRCCDWRWNKTSTHGPGNQSVACKYLGLDIISTRVWTTQLLHHCM